MRKILLLLAGSLMAGAVGAVLAVAWMERSQPQPSVNYRTSDSDLESILDSESDPEPEALTSETVCEIMNGTYNHLTNKCTLPAQRASVGGGWQSDQPSVWELLEESQENDDAAPLDFQEDSYNPLVDDYDQDGSPDRLDNCPMDPFHSVTDDCS